MNVRRQFELDVYKLSNKKHYYEFDIEEKFFDSFEDSYIQKGKLHAKLSLDKSATMIVADFIIDGTVELVCDRSLDEFDFPVHSTQQIIFKFGEEYEEVSDEIIIIPHDTQKLDVAQYIYEYIGLSIPMKKLHPRFQEEEPDEEDDDKDGTLVYSTAQEDENSEEDTETNDPSDIWEKLKSLKNNNN